MHGICVQLPGTLDRGGIAPGGGADGEGGASPLPCLHLTSLLLKLAMLAFPHPTRASRSSPAPKGAGAVRGDIPTKAVGGVSDCGIDRVREAI